MPFGGLLSLAAPALGIGSSIAGLLGGTPASNVQLPSGYSYGSMPGADTGAYSGIGNLSQYNVPAQLLPQYQGIAQSMVNNPYAAMYQGGANVAGQTGYGAGQAITGTGLDALSGVDPLLLMGFDPQNAYYARAQQRLQDQVRAGEGARGIAMSPYGAGLENQAMSNFGIDWQNSALARAAQGAGAAGGLLGQAAGGINTGLNTMQAGAGLPYNTFQGINANALNTLGQTGQFGVGAAQLPQQQIQDYLAYLSQGTGQQQANTQLAGMGLNQANLSFNQGQQLGQGLGSGLAGLSRAFGNQQNTGWGNSGWGNPGGTGGGLGGLY